MKIEINKKVQLVFFKTNNNKEKQEHLVLNLGQHIYKSDFVLYNPRLASAKKVCTQV